MKSNTIICGLLLILLSLPHALSQSIPYNNEDFAITAVDVHHLKALQATVWSIQVKGRAGNTLPTPAGQLDGAPVLGYVFPTTLNPEDVGFSATEGTVALALTSHPDFDDTPLWDENNDRIYNNDGIIWHPHWVVLVEDQRVTGGLSVKEFKKEDQGVILPPTNPGMPMFMDSPGYSVSHQDHRIQVLVPDYRINRNTTFSFDGVTAYLKVNTSNADLPMLGVYEVFSIATGKLSFPFRVKEEL